MRILLANDDGYLAPGLQALHRACEGLGELHVVAPEQNASGTSNSLSLHRPLSLFRAPGGFHFVNGTPSDCVHVALTAVLEQPPDLIVSGINNGANLGEDTLYSGTVAAAMEGFLFGIPAIAFSLVEKGWEHLDAAEQVAREVIREVIERPPAAAPYLLNVNIPNLPLSEMRGRRLCRLGRRHASAGVIRQVNPRGEPMYWIGPTGDVREAGEGTDFHAVAQGFVSVTPLQIDLTHHAAMPGWQQWLAGGAR